MDIIRFNLDPYRLGQMLRNDPSALQLLINGMQAGECASTEALGYAQLGGQNGSDWYTLFANTDPEVAAGSPKHIRHSDDEKRIRLLLKRQKKQQAAHGNQQLGDVLAEVDRRTQRRPRRAAQGQPRRQARGGPRRAQAQNQGRPRPNQNQPQSQEELVQAIVAGVAAGMRPPR